MPHSRSVIWSNNELMAHKKNVGEEARLLSDLDIINRRKVLSTSGLNVKLRKLHSDLKDIRTSTGHSMDVLPPTPFRLHRFQRTRPRASVQSLTSQFHPQQASSPRLESTVNKHLPDSSSKYKRSQEANRHEIPADEDGDDYQFVEIDNALKHQLPTPTSPASPRSDLLSLGQQPAPQTISPGTIKSDALKKGQSRRVSVEFILPTVSDLKRPSIVLTEDSAVRESSPTNKYALEMIHSYQTETASPCEREGSATTAELLTTPTIQREVSDSDGSTESPRATPLGREITEILQSVRRKNEELLAVKAAVVTMNSKSKYEDEEPQTSDQLKLSPALSKKAPAKLPSTRYKCRTCIERLRDNIRYRQSLEKDGDHKSALDSHGTSGKHGRSSETFPNLPGKDLDGNVLSAFGKLEPKRSLTTKQNGEEGNREGKGKNDSTSTGDKVNKATGTIRSRIDQLAAPKVGPTPKMNISGRVLRRQADALRHPHQQSMLTEREQERLLRLQSRVRLFLAVLQERQMPSGMVHIPQRDDIMHVDISHLG